MQTCHHHLALWLTKGTHNKWFHLISLTTRVMDWHIRPCMVVLLEGCNKEYQFIMVNKDKLCIPGNKRHPTTMAS